MEYTELRCQDRRLSQVADYLSPVELAALRYDGWVSRKLIDLYVRYARGEQRATLIWISCAIP